MHRRTNAGLLAALVALAACEPGAPDPSGPASSCAPSKRARERERGEDRTGPVCTACTADPASDPYAFAWQLFASINRRAPSAGSGSNDAVWETWADDLDTFPDKPDPKRPPLWPGDGLPRKKKLRAPALQRLFGAGHRDAHMGADATAPGEEVRRNEAAFQFIADNALYYVEGLSAGLACARVRGAPLAFPRSAIEVKASWKPITADQTARYHSTRDGAGNLIGLVAMHLSSKVLPNWLWATFEHVDNPGRCDDIGCRDDFGADPAVVPPAAVACQAYPAGAPTAALEALLGSLGLGPEWRSYRLKGVQIDFTDAMGTPVVLGNSVTEAGFVSSASCMTCHARAAFDRRGAFLHPFAHDAPPPPPGVGACGGMLYAGYTGAPSPAWFGTGADLSYAQGDFVWAFSDAKPAGE